MVLSVKVCKRGLKGELVVNGFDNIGDVKMGEIVK